MKKSECATLDLWRVAMKAFGTLVNCTIHAFSIHFAAGNTDVKDALVLDAFWDYTLDAIEACLYQRVTKSTENSQEAASEDEIRGDNALQIQLVNLIRDLLSPPEIARGSTTEKFQSVVPAGKVQRCIAVLQRGATGSLQSPSSPTQESSPSDARFSEEFAKACFGALLDPKAASNPVAQQEAIDSLVSRCQASLTAFAGVPVHTDSAVADIKLVLKAVRDVLTSEHRRKAVLLYPSLVDSVVALRDDELRVSFGDILHMFRQFF